MRTPRRSVPMWAELAEQGWLSVHIPEEHGGQGFGQLELAVVVEEMARALVPGPAVPTAVVSTLLAAAGDDAQRKELLAGLVDGTTPAAVALPGSGAFEAEVGERRVADPQRDDPARARCRRRHGAPGPGTSGRYASGAQSLGPRCRGRHG